MEHSFDEKNCLLISEGSNIHSLINEEILDAIWIPEKEIFVIAVRPNKLFLIKKLEVIRSFQVDLENA